MGMILQYKNVKIKKGKEKFCSPMNCIYPWPAVISMHMIVGRINADHPDLESQQDTRKLNNK